MTDKDVRRRQVLVAGAVGSAGVVGLAGCGSGEDASTGSTSAASSSSGSSATSSGGGSAAGETSGEALVAVSEVPVGGAVSVDGPDGPLIVAQPSEGEIVAYSAICTHQQCTVAPDDGILRCPCHGSTYEVATGDNVGGPAPAPLSDVAVKVEDGQVVKA